MNLPLSETSNLILYADDILLYRAIKCDSDYSVLQDDINTINYWVEENHMQFNTAKCKYMLISHKRHKTTSPTALTIASHQIDKVESFKYLGLLFTSDLSGQNTSHQYVTKPDDFWACSTDASTNNPNLKHYSNYTCH